ncbi:unnamed protein product [Rhizophagus irregularis]|nr:unnamed protein product [Rhizophagus irregularis]
MDDSTLIFASLDGLQHLLSIARDFYFLNNITANFSKYELVCSFIWFNLQGSLSFVISQIKDIYFALRFKKLTSAQLAYLHSAVILPKVYFRSQVTYIPEATLTRTIGSYYGIHKKLLSLSHIFPSLALSSKFFNEDTNPYTYLCQQLISRFMAWNSSRRSIHHNWIFQTLHILYKSSLTIKLPAALCLDLMSTHFVLLVTLSSELANFEKATWLFSPLWSPVMPLQYPSYLLKLQDSALVTIDEHSYIKARNRYYWIAGLGYSYVRIPELFLMDSSFPSLSKSTIVSHQLPAISFDIDPKLCLGIEHYIYLHAKCSKSNPISSNEIPCR